MSLTLEPATPPDDGVHHYTFLCLTALGVMTLAFFVRGVGLMCLLPAAVGGFALVFRWRTGALGVLFFVGWLVIAQNWPNRDYFNPLYVAQQLMQFVRVVFRPPGFTPYIDVPPLPRHAGFGIADVLLCAATMVYMAGYHRLLSLTHSIFPIDPRRGRRKRAAQEARSRRLVSGSEIANLVASVSIWLVLAWLCWRWLEFKETLTLDIEDYSWQLMLLTWLLGLVFLLASGLVHYIAQGHLRPEEAALFLQDTLWRETSREQRRIHRWFVWARRRRQRKEES
jgi:hypothetical protein